MGMFDQEIPQELTPLQEIQMAGGRLAERTAPFLKESVGYESPEREMRRVASETDLSNSDSVEKTFNFLMSKNPQAAASWLKSVKPIVDQHIKAQKSVGGLSGTFADTMRTAAFIENCDLNDPECRKRAFKTGQQFKRGNPFDQASASKLADQSALIYKEGENAVPEKARYTQLLNILPDIYTGWGGEIMQSVYRFADVLGIDKETAGKMEQFTSEAMNQALSYVSQTKGAVSDREFGAFLQAAAGIERTQAGNRLILNTALKYAEFREKKAKEMARWVKAEKKGSRIPTQEGWNAYFYEWARRPENIIVLPTDSEIDQARNAPPASQMNRNKQQTVDDIIQEILN